MVIKFAKKREMTIFVLQIVVIFVILLALMFFTFYSISGYIKENLLSVASNTLRHQSNHLNKFIDKSNHILLSTTFTVEHMLLSGSSNEDIKKFLELELKKYNTEINHNYIDLYGYIRGELINGSDWVPPIDYIASQREWFTSAKKSFGSVVYTSAYKDARTGKFLISVSKELYEGSVLTIDVLLDDIQEISKTINLDGMGYGVVLDYTGLVIANSNEAEYGVDYRSEAQRKQFLDKLFKSNEDARFNVTIDGSKYIVFANKLMNNWYIAMLIDESKLNANLFDILNKNIIICAILFVLVVFFLTFYFRKVNRYMRIYKISCQKADSFYRTIMTTLTKAIDAKDRYTNGHSVRVAQYALEIAKRMGKNKEEQQNIYYAALLHDVGKIHIPDSIINKPSRLDDNEWEYMKLHSTYSFLILKDIKPNDLIAAGAKWHHERYDGQGYPDGLAGEDIPEIARIIAVADAYDAMTSNRSYRKLMTQEKVRSEILNGLGKQFDPQIGRIMLSMISEDANFQMRHEHKEYKRVLVLDDQEIQREYVDYILTNNKEDVKFKVDKCSTYEQMLALLENSADDIDVILLDIMMPEKDGFEVFEKIKNEYNIPVIVVSSNKNYECIKKAYDLGVDDYVIKPAKPLKLIEIILGVLHDK